MRQRENQHHGVLQVIVNRHRAARIPIPHQLTNEGDWRRPGITQAKNHTSQKLVEGCPLNQVGIPSHIRLTGNLENNFGLVMPKVDAGNRLLEFADR